MDDTNRSFLGRFGDFLLDGLQAGAALQLQREFAPQSDLVFTPSPVGAQPVGVTTPASPPRGSAGQPDILLLGLAGFALFQLLR